MICLWWAVRMLSQSVNKLLINIVQNLLAFINNLLLIILLTRWRWTRNVNIKIIPLPTSVTTGRFLNKSSNLFSIYSTRSRSSSCSVLIAQPQRNNILSTTSWANRDVVKIKNELVLKKKGCGSRLLLRRYIPARSVLTQTIGCDRSPSGFPRPVDLHYCIRSRRWEY